MLEHGHTHKMVPVSVYDREGGYRVIRSRCQAVQPTPEDPTPACPLEEERIFVGEQPVSIRFKLGGTWIAALDLLRLLPLGVEECPTCEGETMLVPCQECAGLGVSEAGGGWLAIPDLHVKV